MPPFFVNAKEVHGGRMNATETFTLRMRPQERKMLTNLARLVGRSESDTIRFVVRETLKAFQAEAKRIPHPSIDDPKQEGSHVTK
jgi:hypothetical protein